MFDTLMWALYFVDVLSRIQDIATVLFALMLTAIGLTAFFCMLTADYSDDFMQKLHRVLSSTVSKIIIVFVLLLYFTSWAIPTKETMHMMLGVKATGEVVNSETGQKVQRALNAKLDEYLGELSSKKKENK